MRFISALALVIAHGLAGAPALAQRLPFRKSFDSAGVSTLDVSTLRSTAASNDDQRPHHVMFLVLEDVAVPDVLVSTGARTWRHREWCRGQIEFHDDGRALTGVHSYRFQPRSLGSGRRGGPSVRNRER